MKKEIAIVFTIVMLTLASLVGLITLRHQNDVSNGNSDYEYEEVEYTNMKTFTSFDDMQDFLSSNAELSGNSNSYYNLSEPSLRAYEGSSKISPDGDGVSFANSPPPPTDSGGSQDHSTTNVQEVGVDEGDIVKNDGQYAYVVSRDTNSVIIAEVYPPAQAEIVNEIELEGSIIEIYVSNNKLVALGRGESNSGSYESGYYRPGYYSYSQNIFVKIYDISSKTSPTLWRSDDIEGSYISSRLVGDHLYLVARQSVRQIDNESSLPAHPSEIYYVDEYDHSYTFTNIISINVQDSTEAPTEQVILMGSSSEIYVSLNNIYLTYKKILSWAERKELEVEKVILPIVPITTARQINETLTSDLPRVEKLEVIDEIVGEYLENLNEEEQETYYEEWQVKTSEFENIRSIETERTSIHRISIKAGRIQYQASGGVPGYILNRFSMGEYQGYFRIATTTGHVSRYDEGTAKNHLFVLDLELNIVGKVTDIAPGERIYSARFMGKRAYLVTFDKVDPFFVIDVSNPTAPTILGELKIPGYSDYLHPYDENHVIGLGKDTVLAEEGTFSWYQGVKLSLFEVTDVNNPKEISKYIIGDRGTYSTALNDPHAFMFSRAKNLLVLPIILYEIDEAEYPHGAPPNTRGEFVWDGAYVFETSLNHGFDLKGRISHSEIDIQQDNYWGRDYDNSIKRTFYIDEVLYTVSNNLIKANNLNDLHEVNSIELVK